LVVDLEEKFEGALLGHFAAVFLFFGEGVEDLEENSSGG